MEFTLASIDWQDKPHIFFRLRCDILYTVFLETESDSEPTNMLSLLYRLLSAFLLGFSLSLSLVDSTWEWKRKCLLFSFEIGSFLLPFNRISWHIQLTQLSLFPGFVSRLRSRHNKDIHIQKEEKACQTQMHTSKPINTQQTRFSTTQFFAVHYHCDRLYAKERGAEMRASTASLTATAAAATSSSTKKLQYIFYAHNAYVFFPAFWSNSVQCGEAHFGAFVAWLLQFYFYCFLLVSLE